MLINKVKFFNYVFICLLFVFILLNVKPKQISEYQQQYLYLISIAEFGKFDIDEKSIEFSRDHIYISDTKTLKEEYLYKSYRNSKFYNYHFFFNALTAAPFYHLLKISGIDIKKTFLARNGFLLALTLLLIINSSMRISHKILATSLFFVTPLVCYLSWPIQTFFVNGILSLSALCYLLKYRSFAYVISIFSTIQQPLLLPYSLYLLYENLKFKFKKNIYQLFILPIALIQPFFYLYHFGTPQILINNNVYSISFISIEKIFSFYFDLNQGLFIYYPLIFVSFFLIKKEHRKELLFLLIGFFISIFISGQSRWSPISEGIFRYTSLIIPILGISVFLITTKYKDKFILYFGFINLMCNFLIIAYITNLFTHNDNNLLSKLVLNNFPNLYNPVDEIFIKKNTENNFFPIIENNQIFKKNLISIYSNKGNIKKIFIIDKNGLLNNFNYQIAHLPRETNIELFKSIISNKKENKFYLQEYEINQIFREKKATENKVSYHISNEEIIYRDKHMFIPVKIKNINNLNTYIIKEPKVIKFDICTNNKIVKKYEPLSYPSLNLLLTGNESKKFYIKYPKSKFEELKIKFGNDIIIKTIDDADCNDGKTLD